MIDELLVGGPAVLNITSKYFGINFVKMLFPNNVESVLAVGENFEFSLLQIAISFAENGLSVWFISPQIFDKTPKKVPDKEILQLLTFMYLKDYNDLIVHLNGVHLWHKIPNIIIVTGFETYSNLNSNEYNPLQAALVGTTLLDGAAVCGLKTNKNIFLLVTCTKPTSELQKQRLQTIRNLYFSNYLDKDDTFCHQIMKLFK